MKYVITIIGISGASCTGKSWIAQKIQSLFPNDVCLFELDKYYKGWDYVEQLEFQHDNPSALDYDKVLKDIEDLCHNKVIQQPIYNYQTHQVVDYKICFPKKVIIIEGLFAFSDKRIRAKMDFKIWVEADERIKYERRVKRDVMKRGDTIIGVKERYSKYVLPAFKKYIEINKQYADINIINNKI